jgi:16S rRNA (uracil1498-N3)-methyltransferase
VAAPWFFAERSCWKRDLIVLDSSESHHAVKVLRLSPSDVVTVTDGEGTTARCAVREIAGASLVAEILDRRTHRRPAPELVVFQGAPKGRKADEVIERLAEIGAAEVRIFEGMRSVVRWNESRLLKHAERWSAIARGASKQSRNPFVARTGPLLSWEEMLGRIRKEALAVALWEEATRPLREELEEDAGRVALVIGPEGGLDRSEAHQLEDWGAKLVSLGTQILRTENAPVVGASAVLFHYGVIG